MSRTADDWARALDLRPHPEGGWFRETHRAGERVPASGLPERFAGPRACATAIVFLLRAGERSRFHRLRADEVWHLYDGGPLHLHVLAADGHARWALGRDLGSGERPQLVVPHGTWFAAEVGPGASYALAGCTVAPGFEFEDWELGARGALLAAHPQARDVIERFTEGEA